MKKQYIKPNDKDLYELLKEYKTANVVSIKKKLKSTIVSQMIPIVKHIAKTIARRSYDPIDDLIQAGFIGVLKAIDNFCETKNDNFKVYAGYLIIGEMKHYIRDKLDTIRVPRHIQELTIRINSFINTLTIEEVYNLTSEYVADALQIPVQDVDFAMQVDRRRATISLDELYAGDDHNLSYEERLCSNSYYELSSVQDAKIRFDEIIDELPPEERVLIDLYYNQDLSKKEIAKQMDLKEKQVARILSKAFKIMHNSYAENGEIW